ncbi:hypothetical protein ACFC09_11010 [Streptomyces sp. NPDC056161]|uniref:hypothetical protein n=1 Tax=Streptomyces sp. NPDC056161 TaxID=3345732 RepID=UPI0035D6B815
MTLRGGLLVRLWGTALAEVVPLMALTGLSDAVHDEAARHLRIEVRATDTLRAAAGLDKGGAFIALCQVARWARPTGCGALGEMGAEGVSP